MVQLLLALPFFTAALLTLTWDWFGAVVTDLAASVLVTVLVFLVVVGIFSAFALELLEVEAHLDLTRTTPPHR